MSCLSGIRLAFWRFWWLLVMLRISTKGMILEMFERHKKLNIENIDRKGEVVIVTGGTRGIGAETVKKFLQCNMHVIIGCRNTKAGDELIEKFRKEGVTKGEAECIPLDLMSLKSVRDFVLKFEEKGLPLHILVNNAGIMFAPYKETEDKLESHFQTNFLGHFLLSVLLLPKLNSSASDEKFGRIVNVSASMCQGAKVDWDDLQMKNGYSPYKAYMDTKLLQLISVSYLDRKCKQIGLKVYNNALHPGVIMTDLGENLFLLARLALRASGPFMKTPEQGCECTVFAALTPELDNIGGVYLHNSKISKFPVKRRSIEDMVKQDKLWKIACELADLKESILHN